MKKMILVGQISAQRITVRNERRFRFLPFGAFSGGGMPLMGCAVLTSVTE